jgi:hypothetical protein
MNTSTPRHRRPTTTLTDRLDQVTAANGSTRVNTWRNRVATAPLTVLTVLDR